MGCLTDNRPKSLVSVDGRPILYSITDAFGDESEVIIIGDYKADALKLYLQNFPPPFPFELVQANGKGTCSGIQKAIDIIEGDQFVLVWSDLFFHEGIQTSDISENSIGLTGEIVCRYSYADNRILEIPNVPPLQTGIMGIFFFPEPAKLPPVPNDGEFVKFLSTENVNMSPYVLQGVKEIGTIEEFRKQRDNSPNSRFFNELKMENDRIVKKSRERKYDSLISDEINWYRFVRDKGFKNVPTLLSFDPLIMTRIVGSHPFELPRDFTSGHKTRLKAVKDILNSLNDLHRIDREPFNFDVAKDVYVNKTIARVTAISKLIPYKEAADFTVNGIKVPNYLLPENRFYIDDLFSVIKKRGQRRDFDLIHGDPTFSNIILESETGTPIFIDPRGYFGRIKIFGDPLYDYAKLYYSAVGNYDYFNRGKFCLKLNQREIKIDTESEEFEFTEKVFDEELGASMGAVKAIHALIWLSLSGYVTNDYDAVLASFFHGLELSTEVLEDYG